MKLKVRSDDASTLRKHGWPQMEMGDWLAQLRDDSRDEPPRDGHAGADDPDHPRQEALAQADVRAEARAYAQADAGARASAHAGADASAGETGRAMIGDQLRMPIMWCEMGSCISWYTDLAALGEADTRARAIGAGWRIDGLGQLACPRCQQSDPGFWASRPVVPCHRDMAGAWVGTVPGDRTGGRAAAEMSRDLRLAASGYPPASLGERELHHDVTAAEVMPAGRRAEDPAATVILAARS